jgi:hypothetical protein
MKPTPSIDCKGNKCGLPHLQAEGRWKGRAFQTNGFIGQGPVVMSFNVTPWGDEKKPMCDPTQTQFNMTRPAGANLGIQTGVYQGCVVDHGLINCTQ